MNSRETGGALLLITGYWPQFKASEIQTRAWCASMESENPDQIKAAIEWCAKHDKFPPSIARLREVARLLRLPGGVPALGAVRAAELLPEPVWRKGMDAARAALSGAQTRVSPNYKRRPAASGE